MYRCGKTSSLVPIWNSKMNGGHKRVGMVFDNAGGRTIIYVTIVNISLWKPTCLVRVPP